MSPPYNPPPPLLPTTTTTTIVSFAKFLEIQTGCVDYSQIEHRAWLL